MHPARRRRAGVFKLAIPVAVIVILVVAGAYAFVTLNPGTPSKSTSSSSTTSLSPLNSVPTVAVSPEVNQFISDLNTMNINGLMTFYGPNAVDVWSGKAGGLSGRYGTTESIQLIYATSIGKSNSTYANIVNYAEKAITPTETNTTYLLSIVSYSAVAGKVTARVNVTDQWDWGSTGWHITKENWSYLYYNSSYSDTGSVSATTFPQWGYSLKGGNPNLVSEKSFEWHAGPFLAAGVYAFLLGVVAFGVMKYGKRPGSR
jgi:hypothetical protein